MKQRLVILFLLGWASQVSLAADIFIEDYGTVADGRTLNTGSIQRAIDACSQSGGGRVFFTRGDYLTGTIELKDGVTLYVARNSRILGSVSPDDYPDHSLDFRFYHDDWMKKALIFALRANRIGIEGPGIIDGQGAGFSLDPENINRNRPFLIWFVECLGVSVRDIELRNSAMWMQHYMGCEQVRIDGITVYNHVRQNNDMIDISSCKDVVITRVIGDTDDDGITLKSLYDKPTENITVSDCILSSHCNAIKIGTETIGDFRNITITNCVVRPSAVRSHIYGSPEGLSGISLETVDGACLENITISNITLHGPKVPLFIRLAHRGRMIPSDSGKSPDDTGKSSPGRTRGIVLSVITATYGGSIGSSITGIPGSRVEDISLSEIRFYYTGGGTEADAVRTVPEKTDSYPESTMFGVLPAYGFYVRHARNIRMRNVTVALEGPDDRPAFIFDDAVDCTVD